VPAAGCWQQRWQQQEQQQAYPLGLPSIFSSLQYNFICNVFELKSEFWTVHRVCAHQLGEFVALMGLCMRHFKV
jgi:hypothetical protein